MVKNETGALLRGLPLACICATIDSNKNDSSKNVEALSVATIKINGKNQSFEGLDPSMPLLWALRDHAGIQGVKYGCGVGQCGACTVWLDGYATRSCQLTVGALDGRSITTIEGLAKNALHPVQQAWIDHDVAQCGYCQAGQIMSAAALLERNPSPTDDEIDAAMAGNICRCGTYVRIKSAIQSASGVMTASALFYDAMDAREVSA